VDGPGFGDVLRKHEDEASKLNLQKILDSGPAPTRTSYYIPGIGISRACSRASWGTRLLRSDAICRLIPETPISQNL
jgi:hypothetical protein